MQVRVSLILDWHCPHGIIITHRQGKFMFNSHQKSPFLTGKLPSCRKQPEHPCAYVGEYKTATILYYICLFALCTYISVKDDQ